MDDFNWVTEPEKEKRNWLKEYWLHGIAAIVILALLLLLVFNPSSKKVTPGAATGTMGQAASEESTTQNKQITFRLPNKTTKVVGNENDVSTTAPIEPTPTLAENTAAPVVPTTNAAPKATTTPPKSLPPASLGVIKKTQPVDTIKDINATATTTTQTAPAVPATSMASVPDVSTTTIMNMPVPEAIPLESEKNQSVQPAQPTPATSAASTPAPAAVKPAPAAKLVTPPPPATATTPQPQTSVLHMMLKRPATNYTVQLYASASSSQVQQFIARHDLASQSTMVKVWQNGQDFYLLLYGDYANQSQADAAINQLAPALRTENPSARSMQSVQEGIRQRLARGR